MLPFEDSDRHFSLKTQNGTVVFLTTNPNFVVTKEGKPLPISEIQDPVDEKYEEVEAA